MAVTFEDRLRDYATIGFTDQDVTSCTGLSVRSWRELIKSGAVRTATQARGRGRIRTCDATTFKRTAIIAAINGAGYSLPVAGRLAYLLPFDRLLYSVCDPRLILLDSNAEPEQEGGLRPRLKVPKADWFDPEKPAKADPEDDWLIEIYDGRFVGQILPGERDPLIYGELRDDSTRFVAWFPFHQLIGAASGARLGKWQHPWAAADQIDTDYLQYEFENHDSDHDPLCIAASAAALNPVFKITINLSLAIRRALRRYLGIEPGMGDLSPSAAERRTPARSKKTAGKTRRTSKHRGRK